MVATPLLQYARTPVRRGCTACEIVPPKIGKELEAARRGGVGFIVMSRWLREIHGIAITKGQLDYHFCSNHTFGEGE